MSNFSGMDVDEVDRLVTRLSLQADVVTTLIGVVDTAISGLAGVWSGDDLHAFSAVWHQTHRPKAQLLGTQLGEWVTELRHQIAQQRATSGEGAGGVGGLLLSPNLRLLGAGGLGSLAGLIAGASASGDASVSYLKADGSVSGTKWVYDLKTGQKYLQVVSADGSIDLIKADANGQVKLGDVTLDGDANVRVGADASGDIRIDKSGVSAGVSAEAGASAAASGALSYGIAKVGGQVEGFAGAKADAKAHIGTDGASAEAGAFAGAEADASGSVNVGGVGAKGGVGVTAGIGAQAKAEAGMHNGEIHVGGEVKVSVGVGVDVKVNVSVNPGEVEKNVENGVKSIGHFFGL